MASLPTFNSISAALRLLIDGRSTHAEPHALPHPSLTRHPESEPTNDQGVDLSAYTNEDYDPGAGKVMRAVWYLINCLVFMSPWVPFYRMKRSMLRMFGAKVGRNVVIKPGVNIKYPWNLTIGDNTWVGEKVHLDSLAPIHLGRNVCLSQYAYLCTGSHNWSDPKFGLIVKPIVVEDGAWVACRATVLPGVTVRSHSVIAAHSMASKDTVPYMVHLGVPAEPVKHRHLHNNAQVSADVISEPKPAPAAAAVNANAA